MSLFFMLWMFSYIGCRLERRFLERVAQTNRVKTSGGTVAPATTAPRQMKKIEEEIDHGDAEGSTENPPWLRPPNGYKPGAAAAAVSFYCNLYVIINFFYRLQQQQVH